MSARFGWPLAVGLGALAPACAHPPSVTPTACPDCVEPGDLVALPAPQLVARLAALQAEWTEASADDPSPATCDAIAMRYAELADAQGRSVAVGRFNAGVVRARCGEPDRAIALYRSVADDAQAPPKIRAAALNNLGIEHARAGSLDAARTALLAAIEADPLAPGPRTNLAAVLRERNGDSDEAFAAAEHQLHDALALRSDDPAAFEGLARLYYLRGREGDASYLMLADLVVTQGLRVLERSGQRSAALSNVRGLIWVERGDPVRARKAFEAALDVDDRHAEANLNLAMIALRMRDFGSARRSLRIALDDPRFSGSADAWLALGVAERGLRAYDEAEAAFTFAHETAHDPRGGYNLGLLYAEHIAAAADTFTPQAWKRARAHFSRFEAEAGDAPELAAAVNDARHRRAQIDQMFADIHDTDLVREQVERLEALEKKQRAEEKARLLQLERRAIERRDADADADAAAAADEGDE